MSSELEQHRIVEELVDGYVLGQSFSPSGLQHELSSEMRGRLWLQRPDGYTFVQGITGDDLPVVEHRQTKGLTLGVSSQIRFKTKAVYRRDESFYRVKRTAWNWSVLSYVSTTFS